MNKLFFLSMLLFYSLSPVAEQNSNFIKVKLDKYPSLYIIGGSNDFHSKWQAKLDITIDNEAYHCGGVIINNQWVLTAAHCLVNNGENANHIKITTLNNKVYEADSVYLHKKYNSKLYNYDIGLIVIDSSSRFDSDLNLILANDLDTQEAFSEFDNSWNANGNGHIESLHTSGYGLTHINNEYLPSVLQSVLLAGVPKKQCKTFISTIYGKYYSDMICAVSPSSQPKDSCMGDSGGPLVWQKKNNIKDNDYGLRLVGITSWGDSQCKGFGVYTQVSSYIDWINLVISEHIEYRYDILSEKSSKLDFDPFTNKSVSKDNNNQSNSSGGSLDWFILFMLTCLVIPFRIKKN